MTSGKNGVMRLIKRVLRPFTTTKTVPVPVTVRETRRLEGKNVLVTGGASGIGFSIAQKCVESGARVVITGRNEAKLTAAAQKIGCLYVAMDVRDVKAHGAALAEALDKLGEGARIDALVNNAGVAGGSYDAVTEEEYDIIMDTNVKGVYFLSRAVAAHMEQSGARGHILNVSSAAALKPAATPYYFSKWALCGMTKGLADVLLEKGITVNAIAPGPTVTPIMGSEPDRGNLTNGRRFRYALPEEIADLAVFMLSLSGDLIVGNTVYITGGSGTVSYHWE